MVKHKLKKLLALALSILLLSSDITGLITAVRAAEPGIMPTASDVQQTPNDFRHSANGRPNLFVDFLGDNDLFPAARTAAAHIQKGQLPIPAAYDQSKDSNPDGPNNIWQRYAKGNISDDQTIFWVGVGIDRVKVFELLKEDATGRSGLTSFEGGFYYDANVVEPYYDPALLPAGANPAAPTAEEIGVAYKATIARANIANSKYPQNTQWSGDYELLRAELDLEPKTDLITQEEITGPSIQQILQGTYSEDDGTTRDWRMTYVSLEMKTESLYGAAQRRLEGKYEGIERDENGKPLHPELAPAAASGNGIGTEDANPDKVDSDYQYLLLIPFRLKAFGGANRLHLRLMRDATHFSMGAGTYGVDPYGAWEKVTTRNPGKDIKLLTRFTGDLYLFGDVPKAEEVDYTALLRIENGGGSDNTARLKVDGDPAVWPVYADADGDEIHRLQSGLGMRLDVHTQNGYKVEVTVTYKGKDENGDQTDIHHTFQSFVTGQDSYYTFVMPEFPALFDRIVTVTVRFSYDNREEFNIYLSDIPQPENTFYVDGDGNLLTYKTGNETTITTNLDENYDLVAGRSNTINTFDPVVRHPNSSHTSLVNPASPDPDRAHADGPMGTALKEERVSIQVQTHADYEAVVRIYRFDENGFLTQLPGGADAGIDGQHSTNAQGDITLPYGGTINFHMPPTDLDVEVTYRLANRREATLEVYHNASIDNDDIPDINVAQLAYHVYDDENIPSMAYSGVVYEDHTMAEGDPRHRQVKTGADNKKLNWVSSSAAVLSGSLGGDTDREGRVWLPDPADMNGGSSMMALLYSSADLPSFQAMVTGLDLATTVITEDGSGNATLTGFRKNLYKDVYNDDDVAQIAGILWELRQQILNDTTLTAQYVKEVTRPGTSTVAYTYFDLTAAQVQDYLLTVFRAEDVNNANQSAYRTANRAYRAAEVVYDRLKDKSGYEALAAPIKPALPAAMGVDATSYVRTYQDEDYRTSGLHNYDLYIKAYQQYVEEAEAKGSPDQATKVPDSYIAALAVPPGSDTMSPIPVKTVSLQSDSDAVAAINAMGWKAADIGTTHTIQTREGRTVWVALEADSAYEVEYIRLYSRRADGSAGSDIVSVAAPQRVAGCQNVYSFEMPQEDCVVRVQYTKRKTRKLNISVIGADGKRNNLSTVTAYTADSPNTVPKLETRTNDGHWGTSPYNPGSIENVFTQSTVTITVIVDEEYNVELRAVNASTISPIQIDGPTAGRDGVYTFQVPPNLTSDVDLTITYTPKEQPLRTATITGEHAPGVTRDPNNKARWLDNGAYAQVLENVPAGKHLLGEITVAPGYYIKSVTATGASGAYPYTITGNGYNGGFGTSQSGVSVPVEVYVDMPRENLLVEVVFGYGIPPAAPENTLTLTVKDDDNTGEDEDGKPVPLAPNYAWAAVYDDPSNFQADPNDFELRLPAIDATDSGGNEPRRPGNVLGKHPDYGNGALSDSKYVDAGKWVKVDFSAYQATKANGDPDPDNSYYVSKVTVGPADLAVSMMWESDHSVSFYMPAGSTGVTVEFSKGAKPTHFLQVQETYADVDGVSIPFATLYQNEQTEVERNRAIRVSSQTISGWWTDPSGVSLQPQTNPERVPPEREGQGEEMGVAVAGEEVTVRFTVDKNKWYVQSVVVISDGAAYRAPTPVLKETAGTLETYETTFRMPTGDAEFLIHYRRGPRKDTPDYAFTLTLSDPDNILEDGVYDDNHITASFHDASGGGAGVHNSLTVGRTPTADAAHTTEGMTGVRHIHAGDVITLDTTIADGYRLEYMLVNPSNLKIYPVWTSTSVDADGVTHATATLTMPPEGIAVVARVVKGDPKQYTANLILHPPAGMTSMSGVGQGTFTGFTGGSLAGYHQSAVFSTVAVPGTTIPYDLYAFDGYYIDRVTVDPPLGVTASLSGSFGYQDGAFNMPAANVNVNVWFRKGWPDEVPYYLDLEVHDSAFDGSLTPKESNNHANFWQIVHNNRIDPEGLGSPGTEVLTGDDARLVYGGETNHLRLTKGAAYDRDTVFVAVTPREGFYADASTISITDTAGLSVPWWYVPGGIAFTMPPRSTTVRINFKPRDPSDRMYEAQLHIDGDTAAGDKAVLSTAVTHAMGSPADADGKTITGLYGGDALALKVTPAAGRHVSAVYAVNKTTGELLELFGPADANGSRTRAKLVFAGGNGEFAMPEADVDVYVRFDDGTIEAEALPLSLMVSGPGKGISGDAQAEATAPAADQPRASMTVDAPGMDTRFVRENDRVLATFRPKDGYAITKLEVYDEDGLPVPYEWISVRQVPPTGELTDQTVWPGTAPDDIAGHPGWEENEPQITFVMPKKGVVIHVTYGAVDKTQEYTAQVVVNDSAYSDQPTPSQNNAWLRNQVQDNIRRKLQTAHPGEWIDLDVSVHPGYRIEYIKVVPQSFGIVPGLPLGPYYTQSTGFRMPPGNVTVYVKFVDDGIDEYSATLRVTGTPVGDNANYGTIVSPRNTPTPPARPTPVYVNGTPQAVLARADMDWITVNYYRNTANAYIKAVTVKTISGSDVPFTQLEDPVTGQGTITFPMVNENVSVTVEYDTAPHDAEVYLHVIDATTGEETEIGHSAGAKLTYAAFADPDSWGMGNINPERRTDAAPWGNTVGAYYAPAGQRVGLTTSTMPGIFLRSAYVIYNGVGQMVDLRNEPASGVNPRKSFVVHPGRNDVYVIFTRNEPDPKDHTAVLMLRAPEDDAGRASIAVGDTYNGNPSDRDRLNEANHGHAQVIAQQGDRVIIQVAPAEGYVIDKVLVTPLGFPLQSEAAYDYDLNGNTISFNMPHRDVAITVVLKRGTNQHYKVKLHYVKDTVSAAAPAIQEINYAQLDWTDGTARLLKADEDPNTTNIGPVAEDDIREGTVVTLTGALGGAPADPAHPDTILSAFVLRANGTLVSLNPPLEGKTAVDGTATNHTASFTMPAADVDVYLVVTTEPPENPWHTAVLVVTDSSPSGVNSGHNKGYLWDKSKRTSEDPDFYAETAVPEAGDYGIRWIAVEEGNMYAVKPSAAPGYTFVPPATLTCNDGAHGGNMYAESITPYIYSDTMGTCNKAALIHFVSDDALELTVVIRDPENPGNVTNSLLTSQPTAGIPNLELDSTNVGGAYQIMGGVIAGDPVYLTATPAAGFTATAQIHYYDGTVADIPLTEAGGILTGSVVMPPNNATIIVTFHGDYTGTLTLVDLSQGDKTAQATMFEDSGTAPDRITVNHLTSVNAQGWPSDELTQLPQGTTLTANMIRNDNYDDKTVTALLNRKGSTSIMTSSRNNAEGVPEYLHTIDRADAEIIFVVRDKTEQPKTYVAAVNTVNKPAVDYNGDPVADPTIAANPTGAASGAIWTTADAGNKVTVTFRVPDGYQVVVSSDHADGPSGTFGVGDQTATFDMPAADVLVTVKYVRTEFELKVELSAPLGTTNPTQVTYGPAAGDVITLAHDGESDSAWLTGGETVTLTQATPDTDVTLVSAFWTADDGTSGFLNVGGHFTMPKADTVVTVIYGQVSPEDRHYIALVETVHSYDGDPRPGNKAVGLINTTRPDDPTLAKNPPYWVEGLTDDAIRVSYQMEPGYVAVVTAYRRGDPTALLPVSNIASASNGTATVTMPGETDIVIRIEYKIREEDPQGKVILGLVGHGAQQGNRADVTSPGYTPALGQLSADGALTVGAITPGTDYVVAGNVDSDVETPQVSTSTMGNELRVYANWATGYQVLDMTVAVRTFNADGTLASETPEVHIPISGYGSAAAGRTLMPYVSDNEAAIVRVYYGNFYTATLHIDPHGADGRDVNDNQTKADDDRTPTVTSNPGDTSINRHLDRLEQLKGGETVRTSAAPGPDQRLVGVVWESATHGASSAVLKDGKYTFPMPTENVDFYAVYKPKDDTSYIAKVKFADDSAHLGSSQNAVTITNQSDPAASKGRYWTAAKEGESVVVNVKVAPGYKAVIVETLKDHDPDTSTLYDFYINRIKFEPNLPLGKDATFSMPVQTDATVIIRFVKGYDLRLEVADTSNATAGNKNQADVSATGFTTLHGESDGTKDANGVVIPSYTPDPPVWTGVDYDTRIKTDVTPGKKADDVTEDIPYRVYRNSPFTGTVRVDAPTGTPPTQPPSPYYYDMPSRDVVESVIFYDDQHPLLAKVELRGESDINGNSATPIIDKIDPAPTTATGTVWTTTTHATNQTDAHTIDLTLTVAKGYIAKIRVRRDNENYYKNPTDETKWDWLDFEDYAFREASTSSVTRAAEVESPLPGNGDRNEVQIGYKPDLTDNASVFPDDVSGDQHFRFTMAYDLTDPDRNGVRWTATDVTVIVEFEFAGTIPQPFDPDNMEMEKIDLDRGFIYGENRGDFALIDIPTLYQDTNKELFDTDNYDKPTGGGNKDAQKKVKYSFFLYDAAKDEYTPLVLGVDVTLEPEDEETLRNTGDLYNYYDYKTKRATAADILDDNVAANAEKTYVGSRFKLIPTQPDEITGLRTDGAQALYDMLNNQSSLARQTDGTLAKDGDGKYYTTLYVIAEDNIGQKSAYTQVWIRPYFAVEVKVISYAPNHETTASLYRLMDQTELDAAVDAETPDGETPDYVTQDARNFKHYRWDKDTAPLLSSQTHYTDRALGSNKYYQKVRVMSSELLGGYTTAYDPGAATLLANWDGVFDARYALTLEKASCLTYTRVDLDLRPTAANGFSDLTTTTPVYPTDPKYYDNDTLTYTVSDTVYFITGDVDGDGYTKWQDYDTVYSYVWRNMPWNNTVTEDPGPAATAAEKKAWKNSVYNPDSMAYRCDLNGDRVLSALDVELVQTVFDYNRSEEDYKWTRKADQVKVYPFGFNGSVKSKKPTDGKDYVSLFGLVSEDEGPFPVAPDEYWDQMVDPDTTDAPPLDNPWVDEDGMLLDGPTAEEPGEEEQRPTTSREEGTVTERPGGEETGEWSELPVFDVGWRAELPFLVPEEDLPQADDNGFGEDFAETPADIMTKE